MLTKVVNLATLVSAAEGASSLDDHSSEPHYISLAWWCPSGFQLVEYIMLSTYSYCKWSTFFPRMLQKYEAARDVSP
jgi:hypothetical protein